MKRAPLYERYRPAAEGDFIGQGRALSLIGHYVEELDRGALAFYGPSGCGKTSAAFWTADQLGIHPMFVYTLRARDLNIDRLREIQYEFELMPMCGTGKLAVLDEAHEATSAVKSHLLAAAEMMQPNRWIIATSTEERCGLDETLYSRFLAVRFDKPNAKECAAHLERIAQLESLTLPDSFNWLRFVQDRHNNLRACLADLQTRAIEHKYAAAG